MKNATYEDNEANAIIDDVVTSSACNPESVSPIVENCNNVLGDSSILFFFLILVCILCNSNCGISQDTLLMFFLVLVLLLNNNFNFGFGF